MLSECPLRSIFPPSQVEKPPDQSCRFVVDSLQIDKRQLRESGKITGGSFLFWVRGDWKEIAEKKELIRFRRRERINQCKHIKTKLHVRLSWILMAAWDPESQCSTLYTHRAICLCRRLYGRLRGLTGTRQRLSNWSAISIWNLDENNWETLSGCYEWRWQWLIGVRTRYVYVIGIVRTVSFDSFLTRYVLTTRLIILREHYNRRDEFKLPTRANSVNRYFSLFFHFSFGTLHIFCVLWLNSDVNFAVD